MSDDYDKLVFNLRDHQMGGRRSECEAGADAIDRLRAELGLAEVTIEEQKRVAAGLRAELAGKEKALAAAKTVIEAKDKAYALIDQRYSAMSAKAATTDSERECNERLTAEIDSLTAELTEARRLIDEARRQVPVGYVRWWGKSPNKRGDIYERDDQTEHRVTPLYAAPVPPSQEARDADRCRHERTSVEDDHVKCLDCPAVMTDSMWANGCSNRWFSSIDAAILAAKEKK